MDLIVELIKCKVMLIILITHDLGFVVVYCDCVVVMEKGRVVETARAADIFVNLQYFYIKKLMCVMLWFGVLLWDFLPEEEGVIKFLFVMVGFDPAIYYVLQDSF